MSNENEIQCATIKFRFTFWWARWLPFDWVHKLITYFYIKRMHRLHGKKIITTEISGTEAGPKTIQANKPDCSFSIDVSEELAKRLRTFTQQLTYSFEEAIELIRNAESWDHLCLIGKTLEKEKRLYCLFHLKLIEKAIEITGKHLLEDDPLD